MKKILIISSHPGAGQTTLAVNLGSGLVRKGYRVMIAASRGNHKLHDYLDSLHRENAMEKAREDEESVQIPSLEIMAMGLPMEKDADYMLLVPEEDAECETLIGEYDHLLVCIDFNREEEGEKTAGWEEILLSKPEENGGITLIVPNKMNSKEWEHNSQELFALAEHFGPERIADPIPACERVHDLPRLGKTVWQIQRQNLQEAFDRLIETVENL